MVDCLTLKLYRWSVPNHLLVMTAGWAGKIITALSQLICVRLVISAVGVEHYAPFALTVAIVGWFIICDLGLGASLQNYISEANVTQEDVGGKIITVCVLLISLWTILNIIFFILSYWLGPLYFQGSQFLPTEEKRVLFFLGAFCGVSCTVGGAIYKVYFAWHKGYLSNLIPALLSVIALCLVFIVFFNLKSVSSHFSPVIILSFCWLIPINVIPTILFFKLLGKYFNYINKINISNCWEAIKNGQGFFLFSVMATLTLQVDYIIISQTLSNYSISLYNVVSKIFTLIFFFYNALIMAIWPVFCEKLKNKQWYDVKRLLNRYITVGVLFVILSTLIFIVFKSLVLNLVVPDTNLSIPLFLIILFGIYYIIRVWCDSYAVILNSTSTMKPFVILVPCQAILSIIFQIAGVKIAELNGLLLGLIMSFIFTVCWGLPYSVAKYKHKWINNQAKYLL